MVAGSPSVRTTALLRPLRAALVLAAVAAPRALAQCPGWDPAFGALDTDGQVTAFAVFDDGSGSALYAGGNFDTIGGVAASGAARWNGATWSAVGAIPTLTVAEFAIHDDGAGPALYAGGGSNAGGGRVWRWDGAGWSQFGPTMAERVVALASFDDGSGPRLHAWTCETIYIPHPVQISKLFRFDGVSWTQVLSANSFVYVLAVHDDGAGPELWIGGDFTTITTPGGTIPANRLARWNGTAASAVNANGSVRALRVLDDGAGPALYAAGDFTTISGVPANRVARRQAGAWSALGAGVSGSGGRIFALAGLDDGSGWALYAAGEFTTAGGGPATRIARWDGTAWSALGTGLEGGIPATPLALAAFDDGGDGDDDLYAGGFFLDAGGFPSESIARWFGCATEAFCFGDGSSGACPCANSGGAGRGCENSASTGGALLAASGSSHPDELVLTSSGELPSALSIFLQGDAQIAASAFGDGLRCAGGNLKRLYALNASAGVASAPQPGDPSITERSAALGDPIAPGSSRDYQDYYRDPDLGFCPGPQGSTFNASNALRIVW